jgi:hypothetical protein
MKMKRIENAIAKSAATGQTAKLSVSNIESFTLQGRSRELHGSSHFTTSCVEAWGTDENGRAWRVIGVHVD